MHTLKTKPYLEQKEQWPQSGQHIMANFDDDHIIVHQAYRPELGLYAAEHNEFGGAYKYSRMSWIKPNFLWMMYRSGWGMKEGQEVTLAITLRRKFFDEILSKAAASSFNASKNLNDLGTLFTPIENVYPHEARE